MTKEEKKEYQRKYRENNKEKIKELNRKWRIKNKNYSKNYYEKNKETINKRNNKWKKDSGYRKMWEKKYRKKPEVHQKGQIRQKTKHLIKYRKIKKLPCFICDDVNSQVHHINYNNPYNIIWLCMKHHKRLHKKLKNC